MSHIARRGTYWLHFEGSSVTPIRCRACGAALHDPNAVCPEPFACLSGPNCPHPRCRPTD